MLKNLPLNSKTCTSGLYIVATPIGNLADITLRAINILSQANAIVCEDTRKAGRLLKHLNINKTKLIAYHDHSTQKTRNHIINRLINNEIIALISDAGTPLISDPGYKILNDAIKANIPTHPIPGASAAIAALSVSGLACQNFQFIGFAPHKKRDEFVQSLHNYQTTLIFYESPLRLADMCERLALVYPSAQAVIARELTKLHEEILRGTTQQLYQQIQQKSSIKGEITILIEALAKSEIWDDGVIDERLNALLSSMSVRSAVSQVSAISGLSRNYIYQRALALKGGIDEEE